MDSTASIEASSSSFSLNILSTKSELSSPSSASDSADERSLEVIDFFRRAVISSAADAINRDFFSPAGFLSSSESSEFGESVAWRFDNDCSRRAAISSAVEAIIRRDRLGSVAPSDLLDLSSTQSFSFCSPTSLIALGGRADACTTELEKSHSEIEELVDVLDK